MKKAKNPAQTIQTTSTSNTRRERRMEINKENRPSHGETSESDIDPGIVLFKVFFVF